MKKGALFEGFSVLAAILITILLVYISFKMATISTEIRSSDQGSRHLLTLRRMISSSDCLAYEAQNVRVMKVGEEIIPLIGKRVFPNVIDVNKLKDFDHMNCIRLDESSSKDPDIYNKIEFFVYDTEKGEYILKEFTPISDKLNYDPISTSHPDEYEKTCEMRALNYKSPEHCGDVTSYATAFPVALMDNGEKSFGMVLFRDCYIGDLSRIVKIGGFR